MRKKLLLGAVAVTALFSWAAKDPILMKVNGDAVKLSEFEYLYHKNNQQQIEKETLEQYLERFIVYKLKVADAKAAGIDTTSAFRTEFAKYKNDLARPYMVDSATIKQLLDEAYYRKTHEVKVAQIMMPLGLQPHDTDSIKAKLDSIRTAIKNGADFGEMAAKYSIDQTAKQNKGVLGYIVSGRLPYEFEKAAYDTKLGDVSPIVQTDYGYHIITKLDERPSRGEVMVEHILKLYPRGANDSIKNVKKQQADSIYALLKAGANFEEIAKKESEDPGSARNGGRLRWFGAGMMVPQFEDVSFSLSNGELSEPFETAYGVHIVKKLNSRKFGTLEENKDQLMGEINGDERSLLPQEAKLEIIKKEYKLKENEALFKKWEEQFKKSPYDSVFVESLKNSEIVAYRYADKKVLVKDIVGQLNPKAKFVNEVAAVSYMRSRVREDERGRLFEYEKENLANKYPEYGNLLNEYYNGMMLYEVSNKNVWDKANTDTKGLGMFFNNNKDKYVWKKPRFKGTVIYTSNDSIGDLVKEAARGMSSDTMVVALKNRFKRDVKIEKVLVPKGENTVVDALVFGGEKAAPKDTRYNNYFLYEGRIMEAPEEASDVRGQVTSDYQNDLEEKWVNELKKKYPVEIDQKVLKMVK